MTADEKKAARKEAAAKRKAQEAIEAAERKRQQEANEQAMKEWAAIRGSDDLKNRIEHGFDWYDQAQREYDYQAMIAIFGREPDARTPDGYEYDVFATVGVQKPTPEQLAYLVQSKAKRGEYPLSDLPMRLEKKVYFMDAPNETHTIERVEICVSLGGGWLDDDSYSYLIPHDQ